MLSTNQEQEVSRESINLEAAKIAWKNLEVLYKDVLMLRSHGCERAATQHYQKLLSADVALVIINDVAKQLKAWTKQRLIYAVTNEQAQTFHNTEATVWAVVLKPWILIQSDNK